MRKLPLLVLVVGVILASGISFGQLPPRSGYSGAGNTAYGGVTICGLNYDCGASVVGLPDGINPQANGATCNVCDGDITGHDDQCNGKGINGNDCDDLRMRKHENAPIQTISGHGWAIDSYSIQIDKEVDIDAYGGESSAIDCSYIIKAKNYQGNLQTTVSERTRACNNNFDERVGNQCPYQGIGACEVTIITTDKSPQRNRKETKVGVSIDSIRPSVSDFSASPTGNLARSISTGARDNRPPNGDASTISGLLSIVISIDGTSVQTCTAAAGTESLGCTVPSRTYSGGTHTVTIQATDHAGNAVSETRTFSVDPCEGVVCANPAPSCDGNTKVYYDTSATCSQGACQNGRQVRETCAYGCSSGACNDNRGPSFTGFDLFRILLP